MTDVQQILGSHSIWCQGEGGRCLVYSDLSDAERYSLRHTDLSGVNLRKADLRYADLRDTRLCGALLSWADLTEANLRGADLSRAELSGANLRGIKVGGEDLRRAGLPCQSVYLGTRSDGYEHRAYIAEDSVLWTCPIWIKAGCVDLPLNEARLHWTYHERGPNCSLCKESLHFCDLAEAFAEDHDEAHIEADSTVRESVLAKIATYLRPRRGIFPDGRS